MFEYTTFAVDDIELTLITTAGGSTILLRNDAGGLTAADVAGVALLGCGDAATAEFCPPDYCAAASPGIDCYCYPDGKQTDPERGSCEYSAEAKLLTSELSLIVNKDAVNGSDVAHFLNKGDRVLVYELLEQFNPESLIWLISPSTGNLSGCDEGAATLTVDLTKLASRDAPYLTGFMLRSNSFTNGSHAQLINVNTFVTASPSAARSGVNVSNLARLTAAGTLEFVIYSIDAAGVPMRDVSNVLYVGELSAASSSIIDDVICAIAYSAAADHHVGECAMPDLATGDFALKVLLGSELVGGGSHNFSVERCPDSFVLDDASDSCTCPAGRFALGGDCVACADGTQKPAPGTDKADCAACETLDNYVDGLTSNAARTACDACEDGFYRDEDGSGGGCLTCPTGTVCEDNADVASMLLLEEWWRASMQSAVVLPCRYGAASCPGDAKLNMSGSAAACRSTTWAYCACGYAGPLCAECDARDPDHRHYWSWTSGACAACDDGASHAPSWGLLSVLGVSVVLAGVIVHAKQKKGLTKAFAPGLVVRKTSGTFQRMQRIYLIGRVKLSIIVFNCQARCVV